MVQDVNIIRVSRSPPMLYVTGTQWRAAVQVCVLQQGVHGLQHPAHSHSTTLRGKAVQGNNIINNNNNLNTKSTNLGYNTPENVEN